MIETLIASSVLIGSICLIRFFGKGRIRPLFLYSLWGLAAARLVIPWFYPLNQLIGQLTSRFSVMNVAEQVKSRVIDNSAAADLAENIMHGVVRTYDTPVTLLEKAAGIDWELFIIVVWVSGAAALAVWFLAVNIRFAKRLKAHRRFLFLSGDAFPDKGDSEGLQENIRKIPVYETPKVSSPCYLCYLGERSIYLPEGMAQENSPEGKRRLSHILAHELCHARHKDEIWGAVRVGLLCYYWVNPFVWAAAILSKKDCELACDEAAIRLLGETERISYGRTLLYIMEHKNSASQLFYAAATIESGGKTMKERIKTLVSRKKYSAAVAAILAGCTVLLAACTFTGSKAPEEPEVVSAEAETAIPETVTEPAVQESPGETKPESDSRKEQIPADNYLDIAEEQYLGEYMTLGLIMREGGTGRVQPPTYTPDEENNQLMMEVKFLDKNGKPLENQAYGWGGGEETVIQFEYWNTDGQVSEIVIHASCSGSSYDLRYQVKPPEEPEKIPMNLDVMGMNGEPITLTEAKVYSNALLLCLEGSEDELAPFSRKNVVLLKKKGWDEPETYRGPKSSKADGNRLQLIYPIERENIGAIEALACGTGGDRKNYAITPVSFEAE